MLFRSPEDIVKVGDEIEVKILRVDAGERKIGLSRKALHDEGGEEGAAGSGSEPPATTYAADKPRELRGGTGSGSGQLIDMPT